MYGFDQSLGMYQRMYAARVLNICSSCYSVVSTIGGGFPLTPRNWCIYIYMYVCDICEAIYNSARLLLKPLWAEGINHRIVIHCGPGGTLTMYS